MREAPLVVQQVARMAARATPRVTSSIKRPRATSWVRKAADHKEKRNLSKTEKLSESKSGETRKALETESGANAKGTPQTKSRPQIRDKAGTLRKAKRQSPP